MLPASMDHPFVMEEYMVHARGRLAHCLIASALSHEQSTTAAAKPSSEHIAYMQACPTERLNRLQTAYVCQTGYSSFFVIKTVSVHF